MATRKIASPAVVRQWLLDNPVEGQTVGARGKFSAEQITRFNKGQRVYKFETGTFKPTRSVSAIRITDKGRKVPITKQVNLTEVREEAKKAGVVLGQRGRIPAKVLEAFVAGRMNELVSA